MGDTGQFLGHLRLQNWDFFSTFAFVRWVRSTRERDTTRLCECVLSLGSCDVASRTFRVGGRPRRRRFRFVWTLSNAVARHRRRRRSVVVADGVDWSRTQCFNGLQLRRSFGQLVPDRRRRIQSASRRRVSASLQPPILPSYGNGPSPSGSLDGSTTPAAFTRVRATKDLARFAR